jgi:hypothetical protein
VHGVGRATAHERDEPVGDADQGRDDSPVLGQIDVRQREDEAQERRQSPAAQAVLVPDGERMRALGVPAGEACLALGEKGRHPLLEVVRPRQPGLRDGLQLELLLERGCLGRVEQALRLPDRTRRHRGEELRDLVRATAELVGSDHLRDEPPGARFLCSEAPARREPLEGASRPE